MKKIINFTFIFFFGNLVHCQESNSIEIGVDMSTCSNELTLNNISKLETKLIQTITISGFSSNGYNKSILISPKFEIYEDSFTQATLQAVHIVKANLTLIVKQKDDNFLFTTMMKEIIGSGSSKEQAISNAIMQINSNDSDIKNFLDSSKEKIYNYYEKNCSNIIKKAELFAKTQQYENSFSCLLAVPVQATSCYDKIETKAVEVYKSYQSQNCRKLLLVAKSQITIKNYSQAIDVLTDIDPSTTCFNEAKILVQSIENKINAEDKKQWDLQILQYKDKVSLNNQRLLAMKEIAIANAQKKEAENNLIIVK